MSKAIMKRSCKSVVTFLKGVINANCEEGFKWFPEVSETDVDVSAIDILYAIEVLERVDDQKKKRWGTMNFTICGSCFKEDATNNG